jgi:hypothetical protein
MVLYDVNLPGLRSALNAREIAHLLRTGQLHARTRCKRKGEAAWRTIGELFPLMESRAATYVLPNEISPTVRRIRRVLGVATVLAVITIGSLLLRGRLNNSAAIDAATVSLRQVREAITLAKNNSSP